MQPRLALVSWSSYLLLFLNLNAGVGAVDLPGFLFYFFASSLCFSAASPVFCKLFYCDARDHAQGLPHAGFTTCLWTPAPAWSSLHSLLQVWLLLCLYTIYLPCFMRQGLTYSRLALNLHPSLQWPWTFELLVFYPLHGAGIAGILSSCLVYVVLGIKPRALCL